MSDSDELAESSAEQPAPQRYHDLELIGSGGLGDVYRAADVESTEHVAIKVLRTGADPARTWHRVRRELTALIALSGHPHVVQLIDLVDVDASPGIVMEYAPYGSVARFVADPGDAPAAGRTASIAEVVLIARHAAAALVVAHEHGIVHRDVKPQNLLVAGDGRVMLCDFGVAALSRTDDFRTRTNARSPRYSSPEEFDDAVDVTVATDVYSLGATLLHLVHGTPPTLRERLAPWVPTPGDDPGVAGVDGIIADCLHPDPDARPTSADLLTRLERLDWSLDDRIIGLDVSSWDQIEPAAAPPVGDAPELDTRARSLEPTLSGPHRPLPERPAADPDRRGISVPLLVAGVVAGVVAVVAMTAVTWGIVGRSSTASETSMAPGTSDVRRVPAETAGRTAGVAVVDRPAGLSDIRTEVVWPFDRLGQCLVQRVARAELVPVDCDEPHDLQRISIAELDVDRFGPDTPFDSDAIDADIEAVCARALEAFVGVAAPGSVFGTAHTRPSSSSWASGDRSFQCLIGVGGRRTIGDAAGAEI